MARSFFYFFALLIVLGAISLYIFKFSIWIQWNYGYEHRAQELICSMVKDESLEEKELAKCMITGQK